MLLSPCLAPSTKDNYIIAPSLGRLVFLSSSNKCYIFRRSVGDTGAWASRLINHAASSNLSCAIFYTLFQCQQVCEQIKGTYYTSNKCNICYSGSGTESP